MKKNTFLPKKLIAGLGALALSLTTCAALANDFVVYDTNLSGANSLPPFHTSGTGTFTTVFNDDMPVIHYSMYYQNLHGDAQAAHLHFAQKFANGGVLFTICDPNPATPAPACPLREGWVTGTATVDDIPGINDAQGLHPGDIEAVKLFIKFGLTYVNVHTEAAGSELRGQLEENDHPLAVEAAKASVKFN